MDGNTQKNTKSNISQSKVGDSKHWTGIKILIFISTVIVAIAFVFFAYRNTYDDLPAKVENKKTNIYTDKLDDASLVGEMRLLTQNNKKVFLVNQPFSFLLQANSNDATVTSMDVEIKNASGSVTFDEVTSLLEGYETFTNSDTINTNKSSFYFALLKENLSKTKDVILNYQNVANITLTSNTTGPVELSLNFTPHNGADSNMLIPEVRDILGKVEGVTVYIGNSQMLKKDTKTNLKGSDISATFVSSEEPESDCIDCTSSITIRFESNSASEDVTFTFGGISGAMSDSQEKYGYIFEIGEDAADDSVELLFAKTTSNEK